MGVLDRFFGWWNRRAERAERQALAEAARACADHRPAAQAVRHFVHHPEALEVLVDLPGGGRGLYLRQDLPRLRALIVQAAGGDIGARVFSRILTGGATYGWPGGWSQDRAEQVLHYKHWTFIALRAVMNHTAAHPCNVAFVRHGRPLAEQARHKAILAERRHRKSLQAIAPHEEIEPAGQDHPLVRLLQRPNVWDGPGDLFSELTLFLLLTGNAYLWKVPSELGRRVGPGRGVGPCELWVIPSHWVWPRLGRLGIEYYEIRPFIGPGILRFPPEEVIHLRFKSPTHKIDGYSPQAAGAEWVDALESVHRSRFWMMRNISGVSGAIELGEQYEDLDDESIDRVAAKFAARMQGEHNYGRPLVLTPGAKFVPLKISPAEMDFIQSADQLRDCTLALWGVPKEIAGIQDAGSEIAMYGPLAQFCSQTLGPHFRMLGQYLTRGLASEWGPDLRIWWDDPTPDNPQEVRATYQACFQMGAVAPDEVRAALLALEPLPGGVGAYPYLPAGLMPLVAEEPLDLPVPGSESGQDQRPALPAGREEDPDRVPEQANPDAPQVQQTEGAAALLSAVGGITGAIEILTQVSQGGISAESAVELFVLFFGVSREDAQQIIGPTAQQARANAVQSAAAPPGAAAAPGDAEAAAPGEPGDEYRQAADWLAGVYDAADEALGLEGGHDPAEIERALREYHAGQSAQKCGGPGSGKPGVCPRPHPDDAAGGGRKRPAAVPPDAPAADALVEDVARAVPEAAHPGVAGKIRQVVGKLRDKVFAAAGLLAPAAASIIPDILDNPDDLKKLGYNPTTLGTVAGHVNPDPVRESLGISTHLAATVASHVIARAVVWAKRRLTGGGPKREVPSRRKGKGSYFETCPRDETGHCLPQGGGAAGGERKPAAKKPGAASSIDEMHAQVQAVAGDKATAGGVRSLLGRLLSMPLDALRSLWDRLGAGGKASDNPVAVQVAERAAKPKAARKPAGAKTKPLPGPPELAGPGEEQVPALRMRNGEHLSPKYVEPPPTPTPERLQRLRQEHFKARGISGPKDEQHAVRLGGLVHDFLQEHESPAVARTRALYQRRGEIDRDIAELTAKRKLTPTDRKKQEALRKELDSIEQETAVLGRIAQEHLQQTYITAMQSVCPDGLGHDPKRPPRFTADSDETLTRVVHEEGRFYPRSWLNSSNRHDLRVQQSAGSQSDYQPRDRAQDGLGRIRLVGAHPGIARHEMAHRMEDLLPVIGELEGQWLKRRTAGNKPEFIGGYEVVKGGFFTPYTGMVLGAGVGQGQYHEVLSTGIEHLFNPAFQVKDPDHYRFTLGILSGIH